MTLSTKRPLIALVSAVPAAIAPAEAAFAEIYPDAQVWNILDDRLLEEADDRGGITAELSERMVRLIRHAVTEGADGILLTCSIYGQVAHSIADQIDVPVFGADDAAFDAAVKAGYRSILLIAPASGPLADSARRLAATADAAGIVLTIVPVVAAGAAAAARSGDTETLVALLHETFLAVTEPVDAILLGQYSISPGASALAELTGLPVLATPQRAAAALKSAIELISESGASA